MSFLPPTIPAGALTLERFYAQVREKGFSAVYAGLRTEAEKHQGVWITLADPQDLEARARTWQNKLDSDPNLWGSQPLAGVPFAVKDNIDALGFPTTAACPAYAYTPDRDAFAVRLLRDAGAVVLGKTNLDQFATGLNGLRSPHGYPENPVNPQIIPGGSSAGSACAVTRGLVCFSLGTDTAGSGRVPASLQGLWGLKPTPGLFSATGVVPACRSLDCVSVFAADPADGALVFRTLAVPDGEDAYSRVLPLTAPAGLPTQVLVPFPNQLDWMGMPEGAALFDQACREWEALGVPVTETDFSPFVEAALLLYEGPWVAERTAALQDFLRDHPDEIFPVTRTILEGGLKKTAVDTFRALWKLEDLKRQMEKALPEGAAFLIPTIPRPFTVQELKDNPIGANSQLGTYTNFMNLAGFPAFAYPAGTYPGGVPFGVTLFTRGGRDGDLLDWTGRLHQKRTEAASLEIFVCGAHMRGLPLNRDLLARGAEFVAEVRTAPVYRMYLLPPPPVPRPSLVRSAAGGRALLGELWKLPARHWGSFLQTIPSPLGLGRVKLEDGREVTGFLGESWAVEGCRELTDFGGWRGWLAQKDR